MGIENTTPKNFNEWNAQPDHPEHPAVKLSQDTHALMAKQQQSKGANTEQQTGAQNDSEKDRLKMASAKLGGPLGEVLFDTYSIYKQRKK